MSWDRQSCHDQRASTPRMRPCGAGTRGRAGLLPFGRTVCLAELVLGHLVSARWAVDASPEERYRR